jgi:cytoskeletal protein CcmA (bactofilin family)
VDLRTHGQSGPPRQRSPFTVERNWNAPSRRPPGVNRTTVATWCLLALACAGAVMMPSHLAVPTARASAAPAEMTGFAVFSAEQVIIGSKVTVVGGLVGGNGKLNVGQSATMPGIRVAGRFQDTSMATYAGDIIANGPVDIGSRTTVAGTIHTSDRAFFSDATIRGSVFALGPVVLGERMTIAGDIHSRGAITGGAGAVIVGGVETRQPFAGAATVKGVIHDPKTAPPGGGNPRTPLVYAPVALPAPTSFVFGSSGDRSCASDSTLELLPGYYGEVRVARTGELKLASGTYYMRRLTVSDDAHLQFELGAGSILLYVNEDVSLGAKLHVTINEAAVTDALSTARAGDVTLAELARLIVMEPHGQFRLGDDSEWAGTVFVPKDRIEIGNNARIIGALLAGGTVELRDGSVLLFEPGTSLVGAPAAE